MSSSDRYRDRERSDRGERGGERGDYRGDRSRDRSSASEREREKEKERKQLRVLKDNEWACTNAKCLFINSTRDRHCARCGKSMPRGKGQVGQKIGKEASEKSKGLFAAEDWACSKCGNINWARRNTCNICNAPKLGEIEARTGYGGGYMDRQVVEYRERNEDDDEFDEFGRKKKKRRVDQDGNEVPEDREPRPHADAAPETAQPSLAAEGDEDEEDEDEDDEDGDDLSKYDFGDLVGAEGASPAHSYDSRGSCCSHSSCTCSGSTCYSSDPERDLDDDPPSHTTDSPSNSRSRTETPQKNEA